MISDAKATPSAETPPAGAAPTGGTISGEESTDGDRGRGRRGGGGGGGGRDGRGGGRGGGGGGGRPGGGRGGRDRRGDEAQAGPRYEEKLIKVNRCATTVKGGRRMSFSALVAVGDKKGKVAIGFGKAKAVPNAVDKAMKDAKRRLVVVHVRGGTIPHEVSGAYRASKVVLIPAAKGTGVIAGSAARAVLECAGIQNILTKQYGSHNAINVAKATMEGLVGLRNRDLVEKLRGVKLS
ncbi:MAG: 30S ribosomal protein S5 [Planctomycetota bacterium]